MSETYSVLIGDVGGTNVRLDICKISKDINVEPNIINRGKLPTQKYPSLEAAIEEYLSIYKNTDNYPLYAVIGLPGPVKNNEILKFSNITHWPKANGDEYAKKFGIKKFVFLNDFTCNAYGIQTNLIKDEDYTTGRTDPDDSEDPAGCLAAGPP